MSLDVLLEVQQIFTVPNERWQFVPQEWSRIMETACPYFVFNRLTISKFLLEYRSLMFGVYGTISSAR